jgi:formamidopyrimidine-DNA glycosylase
LFWLVLKSRYAEIISQNMPELPEVQTIVDDLNKKIKGHVVADFWSDWPKAIKGKSLKNFKKEIRSRKILGLRRIGKNIFIDLSGGKTLYIHLKMTGHLLVKSKNGNQKSIKYFSDKVNSYIHHIWYLDKNKTMEFSDVRKFAKIVLDDTEKINNLLEIKKLGVDAMSKEFTLKKFQEILSRRKNKSVGLVLMDQELISGIGNIYRSEILFEAGIAPIRIIKNLDGEEIRRLYQAIKKVLEKAIKMRGTSDSDYRDTAGAPGNFQNVLRVYRRAGRTCQKCDTIIKRSTLGQRSIFFCPKCQK